MNSYYQRNPTLVNGIPLFSNATDLRNEQEVAAELGKAWGCEIKPFGPLCPIDFYALRNGLMVGLLELKSRTHDSSKYPTVFLNVRKWLALRLAETGLGVPAIFVVRFTDGIFYIPVNDVPTQKITIGGTKHLVKSFTDIEPVIEVPVGVLRRIQKWHVDG